MRSAGTHVSGLFDHLLASPVVPRRSIVFEARNRPLSPEKDRIQIHFLPLVVSIYLYINGPQQATDKIFAVKESPRERERRVRRALIAIERDLGFQRPVAVRSANVFLTSVQPSFIFLYKRSSLSVSHPPTEVCSDSCLSCYNEMYRPVSREIERESPREDYLISPAAAAEGLRLLQCVSLVYEIPIVRARTRVDLISTTAGRAKESFVGGKE